MFRDSEPTKPAPPCSVCRAPSLGAFWEGYLCAECFGAWAAAPQDNDAAEFAWAAARPEDVEMQGVAPSGRRWVSLKKAPHVEMRRGIARAWVLERRKLLGVRGAA